MAATYTYIEPQDGEFELPESYVRFLLNDTAPETEQGSLSDGELGFLLKQAGGSATRAAAQAARRMATYWTKRAGVTSKSVAGLSLTTQYTQTAQGFLDLAKHLETAGTGEGVSILWDDTSAEASDEFDERMFDNTQSARGATWQ